MLEGSNIESRRFRRCPQSGLLCIVCPRAGSCVIDASEQSRADFQELFAKLDARCSCKGVRFRTCTTCGRPANSFPDHRVGAPKSEMYPTVADWRREADPEREPSVPERKVQP